MDVEALANSKIGKLIVKVAGAAMESRLRYRFSGPMKILRGADVQPGQNYFGGGVRYRIPHCVGSADDWRPRMLGGDGSLSDYIEQVSKKVQAAELRNVHVVKRDALDTGLDAGSIDIVLLFSVIPSPTAPLNRLVARNAPQS